MTLDHGSIQNARQKLAVNVRPTCHVIFYSGSDWQGSEVNCDCERGISMRSIHSVRIPEEDGGVAGARLRLGTTQKTKNATTEPSKQEEQEENHRGGSGSAARRRGFRSAGCRCFRPGVEQASQTFSPTYGLLSTTLSDSCWTNCHSHTAVRAKNIRGWSEEML